MCIYMVSDMSNLLYDILRIRRIEEAIANEYHKQEIRCPVHLSIGSEFASVVICNNLLKTDKVFGGHRSHAAYLAKGGSLRKLISELMGKATGCCGGMGGSMHLQDTECGFVASSSIVAGIVPVAVGSSWADKLQGNSNVTIVFLGDGSFEEGVVHESFNFASLHNLPILFVCEDNGLAVTTPIKDRQPKREILDIATAHGLNGEYCRDVNITFISELAKCMIAKARNGKPQFLQLVVERERVHCGIDPERELSNDVLKDYTIDETPITDEIEEAFEYARNSTIPTNEGRNSYAT